jgi:putative ABC transport system ATP-binding protein
MQELVNLSKQGKAVCVVTHDPRLLQYADRIIEVDAGRATEISKKDLSQKLALH